MNLCHAKLSIPRHRVCPNFDSALFRRKMESNVVNGCACLLSLVLVVNLHLCPDTRWRPPPTHPRITLWSKPNANLLRKPCRRRIVYFLKKIWRKFYNCEIYNVCKTGPAREVLPSNEFSSMLGNQEIIWPGQLIFHFWFVSSSTALTCKLTKGRYFDHNFRQFSAKKNWRFSLKNVIILILEKLGSSILTKTPIFSPIF
jgi:hypothetical protein